MANIRRLNRLAGPLIIAQLAFVGMQTTDTLLAARFSVQALAAIAVGGIVAMLGFVVCSGLCLAIAPGIAQRVGSRKTDQVRDFAAAGLLFALLIWFAWALVLWASPGLILPLLSLESEVVSQATAYIRALAAGVPAMGLFFAMRNLIEALGYSRPVMWLGFLALALNGALDYLLMFGVGPLPALGALGCGIATALVDWALGLGALLVVCLHPRFRPYAPGRTARPARAHFRELFAVGGPVAGASFVEHLIFACAGLLIARFSSVAAGAHQIALNFTALVYMVPVGVGQATTVLIGHALGAGDHGAALQARRLGYLSATAIGALVAIILLIWPQVIIGWYTRDPAVTSIAVDLLRIAGVFHLFDAWQTLGASVLRAHRDTAAVLIRALCAYGFIGLPACWLLGYRLGLGPVGIWWSLTIALAAAAGLLALRVLDAERAAGLRA